ncbi:Retrotransposon ty1-Copia subclass [Phytophthora megakarya]|uniref:Retrotransposon ty1-Copia subclass n=1 Tax=Phytophthora megakarya TaxID=4795 RepID=A0A225VGZ7_9STRA|nr:Retrotransposon ty1-Copia subclass [Phytophthora megakarya]
MGMSDICANPIRVKTTEREVIATSKTKFITRLWNFYSWVQISGLAQEAQVVTARGGNLRFHEEFTCEGTYARQLLENGCLDGDHELPENVPVARIKTSMETYLPGWSVELAAKKKQLELVSLAVEPAENNQSSVEHEVTEDLPASARSNEFVHGVVTPTAEKEVTKKPSEVSKARKRKRNAHKKNSAEEKTDEVAVEGSSAEPNLEACAKEDCEECQGHHLSLGVRCQTRRARPCELFKPRLVIHGFKQQQAVTYNETYAPLIRFEAIRAAIYFSVQRGWDMLRYDVRTAFLYGDLEGSFSWSSRHGSKLTDKTTSADC